MLEVLDAPLFHERQAVGFFEHDRAPRHIHKEVTTFLNRQLPLSDGSAEK
jgi:hypothetical protein